jgi:hypothetical protein
MTTGLIGDVKSDDKSMLPNEIVVTTVTFQKAFQACVNQGKIQTGADAGCLRCLDLVNEGKSSKKHMTACPGDFKTDDNIMSPNDIWITTVPKPAKVEVYGTAELNADFAKVNVKNAAADVDVVASDII